MPASEETLDSDKRNLLIPVVSPLTLDDYLPGAGIGEFTPGVPPMLPLVISEVEALESAADEADNLITGHLVNSYNGFASVLSEVNAIIEGDIANSLEKIEATLGKVRSKILDNIANKLDHVYGINASLGFQPPTMDAVKWGLATGDYIGAMENPPQPEQPPTSSGFSELLPPPPPIGDDSPTYTCYCESYPGDESFPPFVANPGSILPPFAAIEYVRANYSEVNYYDVPNFGQLVDPWLGNGMNGGAGEPTNAGIFCDWRVFVCSPDGSGQVHVDIRLPFGFGPVIRISDGRLYGSTFIGQGTTSALCAIKGYNCSGGGVPPQPPTQPPPNPPPPNPPPPQPPTNPGGCAPENFNCGTPIKQIPIPVLVKGDKFCELIGQWLDTVKGSDRPKFADMIKMRFDTTDIDSRWMQAAKIVFGTAAPGIPSMLNRFGEWLDQAYEGFRKSPSCETDAMIGPQFVLSWLRLLNQYLPIVPQATLESQTQIVNSLCQYKIPMGSEANAMYLADVIDLETWKCYHKANGNYVAEQEKIVHGMRTRLDPHNISKLYRTKLFGQDIFRELMRQSGVMTELDREFIHETTRSWPGISDVTRFLVRDVADENLVRKYGMDDDFGDKWQGKLIDFADAIGVGKELGKYYWRAHWHIPSFTALKEMRARLRPGRVAEDLEVTPDDMFNALKQDDWLPFWAKRMMAIGQPAIPKSEVVKAYNLHSIDEKELKERLMDLGYSEKDADFYTDYHKAWRKRDEKKKAGWPTLSALVRQYASCLITVDQFKETLKELALSDEQIAEAVDAANLSYDVEIRKVTIQGIMYQYRKGLISEAEANASLSSAGVPAGCVPTLVKRWTSQKLRQPKHAQAAALCKMRRYGIITAGEQTAALIRGGWDMLDAERITAVCTYDMTEEQARKALQDAQRAKREYERQQKEDAKRRKLEQCGPPPCPANTPGGKEKPPIVPT